MNPVDLPITFLTSLSNKLNTLDLINLLVCVSNSANYEQLNKSYFFKILFNEKYFLNFVAKK